jgi:hypothetical protein
MKYFFICILFIGIYLVFLYKVLEICTLIKNLWMWISPICFLTLNSMSEVL